MQYLNAINKWHFTKVAYKNLVKPQDIEKIQEIENCVKKTLYVAIANNTYNLLKYYRNNIDNLTCYRMTYDK